MVRVPVTASKWSTWKRYCELSGVSMGRAIVTLIDRELVSVFGDWASSHAEVGHALDIVRARDPARDVAYSLQILVDAAVMALSPAINDPATAVEVVNELTVVLVQLDELDPGPRAKSTAQGDLVVIRAARTLVDYAEGVVEPILLHGAGDPKVVAALSRLVQVLNSTSTSDDDQRKLEALAYRIEQVGHGDIDGTDSHATGPARSAS